MPSIAGLAPPTVAGLYLLHFEPSYAHAGHYLGYADNVHRRLGEHAARGCKSSPLVRAAFEAGSVVLLARVFAGDSRHEERRLKRQGGLSRHCPICRARGSYHR